MSSESSLKLSARVALWRLVFRVWLHKIFLSGITLLCHFSPSYFIYFFSFARNYKNITVTECFLAEHLFIYLCIGLI